MRRSGWRLFAGTAVAVILAAQSATADDANTCARALSGDEAIAACTRLISSGRYNGRDLAIIYTNRGNAWGGELDRPIADYRIRDYDQAIRLDPTYSLPTSSAAPLGAPRTSTVPSRIIPR
jgi:hypothetical protein